MNRFGTRMWFFRKGFNDAFDALSRDSRDSLGQGLIDLNLECHNRLRGGASPPLAYRSRILEKQNRLQLSQISSQELTMEVLLNRWRGVLATPGWAIQDDLVALAKNRGRYQQTPLQKCG